MPTDSDDALVLLREIRDDQRALLAEARASAERSAALQQEAVDRQRVLGAFYRWVVLASAIVGAGLVGVVVYLAARLLRLLG